MKNIMALIMALALCVALVQAAPVNQEGHPDDIVAEPFFTQPAAFMQVWRGCHANCAHKGCNGHACHGCNMDCADETSEASAMECHKGCFEGSSSKCDKCGKFACHAKCPPDDDDHEDHKDDGGNKRCHMACIGPKCDGRTCHGCHKKCEEKVFKEETKEEESRACHVGCMGAAACNDCGTMACHKECGKEHKEHEHKEHEHKEHEHKEHEHKDHKEGNGDKDDGGKKVWTHGCHANCAHKGCNRDACHGCNKDCADETSEASAMECHKACFEGSSSKCDKCGKFACHAKCEPDDDDHHEGKCRCWANDPSYEDYCQLGAFPTHASCESERKCHWGPQEDPRCFPDTGKEHKEHEHKEHEHKEHEHIMRHEHKEHEHKDHEDHKEGDGGKDDDKEFD